MRENNEGEHSEVGGRVYRGVPHVTAVQETIFTRQGVSGAAHYAVSLALSQPSMEGTSPMFCPMVTDEFTALDLHGQRRNRRGGGTFVVLGDIDQPDHCIRGIEG